MFGFCQKVYGNSAFSNQFVEHNRILGMHYEEMTFGNTRGRGLSECEAPTDEKSFLPT